MDEHQMLEQLAESGGKRTFKDQPPAQMQHLADAAKVLQSKGLVSATFHENYMEASKPVDRVVVELTRHGRQFLGLDS